MLGTENQYKPDVVFNCVKIQCRRLEHLESLILFSYDL